jgi:hypothetical protein
LERRVAELQQTVTEVERTVVEYNQKAVASGIDNLDPTLGQELRVVTQRVIGLAQNAKVEPEGEDSSQGTTPTSTFNFTQEGAKAKKADSRRNQQPQSSPPQSSMSNHPIHPSRMLGYEFTNEDGGPGGEGATGKQEDERRKKDYGEFSNQRQSSNWDNMNLQQYRAEIPDLPVMTSHWNIMAETNAFKPVSTYSFLERTFSRRLLRASYEKAYKCIVKHSDSPQVLHTVRYTLCYYTVKNVAASLGMMIKKGKDESLESWQFPLTHVGGSGLHYPRSTLGSQEPLPEHWDLPQSMGPYPPKAPWVPVEEAEYPRNVPSYADVDGEWFDASDVEQYLKTKGLHLDSGASIAELEIDEPVPGLTGGYTSGSPVSVSNSGESVSDGKSPPQVDCFFPTMSAAAVFPDVHPDMPYESPLYETTAFEVNTVPTTGLRSSQPAIYSESLNLPSIYEISQPTAYEESPSMPAQYLGTSQPGSYSESNQRPTYSEPNQPPAQSRSSQTSFPTHTDFNSKQGPRKMKVIVDVDRLLDGR